MVILKNWDMKKISMLRLRKILTMICSLLVQSLKIEIGGTGDRAVNKMKTAIIELSF